MIVYFYLMKYVYLLPFGWDIRINFHLGSLVWKILNSFLGICNTHFLPRKLPVLIHYIFRLVRIYFQHWQIDKRLWKKKTFTFSKLFNINEFFRYFYSALSIFEMGENMIIVQILSLSDSPYLTLLTVYLCIYKW